MSISTFSLRELEAAVSNKGTKDSLIQDYMQCVTSKGIFFLSDCGLDDEVHRAAREVVMDFFLNGSDDDKQRMKVPSRRGFIGLGLESLAKVTHSGQYPDFSVSYLMGAHDNVFPSPVFESIWTQYYAAVSATGSRLINLTLKVFSLAPVGEYDSHLRFRYYPDLPKERAAEFQPLRIAAHHDASWFTLIHQTACPNGFISNQDTKRIQKKKKDTKRIQTPQDITATWTIGTPVMLDLAEKAAPQAMQTWYGDVAQHQGGRA
jgi:deacetoxycephalosporin-C synthase/deacetoxycephalosporin-C hydroxylase